MTNEVLNTKLDRVLEATSEIKAQLAQHSVEIKHQSESLKKLEDSPLRIQALETWKDQVIDGGERRRGGFVSWVTGVVALVAAVIGGWAQAYFQKGGR